MEIKDDMVKLDNPTKEIHIYLKGYLKKGRITKASQDSLNRTYITVVVR